MNENDDLGRLVTTGLAGILCHNLIGTCPLVFLIGDGCLTRDPCVLKSVADRYLIDRFILIKLYTCVVIASVQILNE